MKLLWKKKSHEIPCCRSRSCLVITIFRVALPPAYWAAFELRCLIIWTQVEVLGSIIDSMPSIFCLFVIWIVCIIFKAKVEESHPLAESAKALLSCFHCCCAQSLFLGHSNSMFSLFPKLDFYSRACVFQWVVIGPKIPPFFAIVSCTSTSEKAR